MSSLPGAQICPRELSLQFCLKDPYSSSRVLSAFVAAISLKAGSVLIYNELAAANRLISLRKSVQVNTYWQACAYRILLVPQLLLRHLLPQGIKNDEPGGAVPV